MNLTLSNFQIHRQVETDIPEGAITYLEGDSDTGKSAKLRALRWLCENKPDGVSFVTFGTPRGTTSTVSLQIDGRAITRERGRSKNLYTLDGETYEAFGRNVPEPILKVLNLSPYAFQLQGEPSFLIGFTPTEAAKVLSEACGLGVIDTAVGYVRGKKTAVDADIRKSEILLDSAQRRLTASETELPLADALECAASLGEATEALTCCKERLVEMLAAEPQGEALDIAAAQERVAAARLATNVVQERVNLLAKMRGTLVAEPTGAAFELGDLRQRVGRVENLSAELRPLIDSRERARAMLSTEPTGTAFDLTDAKEKFGAAKLLGAWLGDVGAVRMRQCLADEPQGRLINNVGAANNQYALALVIAPELDILRGMVKTMQNAILAEPQGAPENTDELKKLRAAIKVCPTCGREL